MLFLRWERFAPGPVRAVIVSKDRLSKKRKAGDECTAAAAPGAARNPAWPSRARFAGKTQPKSQKKKELFDNRRAKFYENTEPKYWKVKFEQQFWSLCCKEPDLDKALASFVKDVRLV